MRGEILSYDAVSGEGLISGDDLMRYRFSRIDVGGRQDPAPGLRVDFVPLDDRASQIIPLLIQAHGLSAPDLTPGEAPLGMWAYFVRCIREKFIDGNGRARRLEYWSFILFTWLTTFAAFMPFFFIVGLTGDSELFPRTALMMLPPALWMLFLVIPGISLASRRLHDVGLSGWLYLVSFVPYVGGLFMLIIACIPSQPHPNTYGPAPQRS